MDAVINSISKMKRLRLREIKKAVQSQIVNKGWHPNLGSGLLVLAAAMLYLSSIHSFDKDPGSVLGAGGEGSEEHRGKSLP